jgi:hypothetical protein
VVFLFRDKSIINIFFLVILSIGVHLHFFVEAPPVISNFNDGVFSLVLKKYVTGLSPTILFILYNAILLIQAIRVNLVLSDLRMFQTTNYTAAMAYVLLSGILTQWCSISPALMANFLLIWLFIKLSRLYNHPSPKTLLFNTGFIVGLAVICYHPTAILILVVLFALAVVRPFNFAEWVILLMGILLPYYFLASFLFLRDHLNTFESYLPYLRWNLPSAKWDVPLIVSLSVLVAMLLAGLYCWQVSNKRMVIQIRKNWGVMIVMLLILLPIPFIFLNAGVESGILSLVPLGAFAGYAFSYPRRLVLPNILFWLALIVLIYNNWWLITHN